MLIFKFIINDVNFILIILLLIILIFDGNVFNDNILLLDKILLWLNDKNGNFVGEELVVININWLGNKFDLLFLYLIEIVLFWGENIDVFRICFVLL